MKTIDYFFAPQSPWTYLGHSRFTAMAAKAVAAGAVLRIKPADIGKVFAVSGGLPLAQRAAQRQAYRFLELQRFSEHLQIPLTLRPKFFPVAADPAAKLIIAVDMHDGLDAAMALAGKVFAACWAHERDIASPDTLAELLADCGLSAQRLADSADAATQARYDANTQEAIALQLFGAPTYVVDGVPFWGQDRLDFVERALAG
jgi:2-hydroxychromene-2-carboxylate isomerase